MSPSSPALQRRLGLSDAVVVGLGSMLGAGVFASFAPAAAAAGDWMLVALIVAALLAWANASSSARLSALYPQSGGTYVYGRERLGPFWGYLAGWSFVVGKTASCAAMAMTVGAYLWPGQARLTAVLTVALLTLVNLWGVQKSAAVSRVLVAITLTALLGVVFLLWLYPADGPMEPLAGTLQADWTGVIQGAGFFFFAFAGYARIATLGEEVRDPARTIPRAIPLALAIVLAMYALVAVSLLGNVGAAWVAGQGAPLAAAAEAVAPGSGTAVRVAAAVAATGSLLGLILGVSRTALAMSRDGHLPRTLAVVSPTRGVPHHAEMAVGLVVATVVLAADLRTAIGFSSFCVLTYYAIANASAFTLDRRVSRRVVPVLGVIGCLVVAWLLPVASVVGGVAVLTVGVVLWTWRHRGHRTPSGDAPTPARARPTPE